MDNVIDFLKRFYSKEVQPKHLGVNYWNGVKYTKNFLVDKITIYNGSDPLLAFTKDMLLFNLHIPEGDYYIDIDICNSLITIRERNILNFDESKTNFFVFEPYMDIEDILFNISMFYGIVHDSTWGIFFRELLILQQTFYKEQK